MPRASDKRERLVEAAKELIHHQGFKQTTLADIAEASGVPLGNVYYYFKTKDEIGAAVIEQRGREIADFFQRLDDLDDPLERLRAFLDLPVAMRESVAKHGCPIGSLCQELDKDRSPLSQQADALLRRQLEWTTRQFQALGSADARDQAQRFLSMLQGSMLVAHALGDPAVVERQIQWLREWLEEL
jgi:TetR/AcrR family transcriptional repressor of nem operon